MSVNLGGEQRRKSLGKHKRKFSNVLSDSSVGNGLVNREYSSIRARADSSIMLAEYLKEGEAPSYNTTQVNNAAMSNEIISLNSEHERSRDELQVPSKSAKNSHTHKRSRRCDSSQQLEDGSSTDMIVAAGNNSLLKDRISTLNQMLKQVKQEEE